MKQKLLKIFIIEDDPIFRSALKRRVSDYGLPLEADNLASAKNILSTTNFDIAIIDLNLNGEQVGMELLKLAKAKGIYSIVLTDYQGKNYIQTAFELGCDHYLTKDQFESVIHIILRERLETLRNQDDCEDFFKNQFLTQDINLINELKSLRMRLINPRPILILGETGVGKGEIAKFIHGLNYKSQDNLIALNASAINENLMESELFGHRKGAFTGAHENKIGKIELAHNGTLFLDEIATIPLSLQIKFLKVLEEKQFYPLGSTKPVKSNFQLITATCDDIYKKMREETFRVDLFYRINAITISVLPLRERKKDIPLLASHFISTPVRCITKRRQCKA
jgi:DNA-binding NtrC family response regulator